MWKLPIIYSLIFISVTLVAAGTSRKTQAADPVIEIQVSNPYRYEVEIELQCDWNSSKNAYNVHQYLLFAGHSIQTILVPDGTKSCRIWPHVRIWD